MLISLLDRFTLYLETKTSIFSANGNLTGNLKTQNIMKLFTGAGYGRTWLFPASSLKAAKLNSGFFNFNHAPYLHFVFRKIE